MLGLKTTGQGHYCPKIIKLRPAIDHQKEFIFQCNMRQEQCLIRT
jgi:hypothetical protein